MKLTRSRTTVAFEGIIGQRSTKDCSSARALGVREVESQISEVGTAGYRPRSRCTRVWGSAGDEGVIVLSDRVIEEYAVKGCI